MRPPRSRRSSWRWHTAERGSVRPRPHRAWQHERPLACHASRCLRRRRTYCSNKCCARRRATDVRKYTKFGAGAGGVARGRPRSLVAAPPLSRR
eukprot:scaffold3767_cov114-Isochrysis_galbana.AAC.48